MQAQLLTHLFHVPAAERAATGLSRSQRSARGCRLFPTRLTRQPIFPPVPTLGMLHVDRRRRAMRRTSRARRSARALRRAMSADGLHRPLGGVAWPPPLGSARIVSPGMQVYDGPTERERERGLRAAGRCVVHGWRPTQTIGPALACVRPTTHSFQIVCVKPQAFSPQSAPPQAQPPQAAGQPRQRGKIYAL